uniref:Uncharacterized protein n=1 Tax=Rhizophora mucronata TaxID=61149 RepID=A0A2P2NG92_RHIMU
MKGGKTTHNPHQTMQKEYYASLFSSISKITVTL